MKSRDNQNWIQVRKALYHQVKQRVDLILGVQSKGLSQYEAQYQKLIKIKKWRPIKREDLLKHLTEKAEIILLGDFHALQQSQKAHLRILNEFSGTPKMCLAVECIESRHQVFLDQYLAGEISEREFLKAIEWKKSWGFPWENFRPLFRWAQKNKVSMVALNKLIQKRSSQTLIQRDRHAARVLDAYFKKNKPEKIILIYGDLHLAEAHLPFQLKKTSLANLKAVSVLQNSEDIYFQMLEKQLEDQFDIIQLKSDVYCLQIVPPWVKWQNYLLFIEEQFDKSLDEDLDLTDIVAQYMVLIAADLETEVRTDNFTVVTSQDRKIWVPIQSKVNRQELIFLKSWVEDGRSFFIPQAGVGILAQATVNHSAQLAMSVVISNLVENLKTPAKMPGEFLKLIWLEGLQYFGSKLINPKRKTDTILDIKNQLAVSQPDDRGRAAMQLALSQKMAELVKLSGGRKKIQIPYPKKIKAFQGAARILGGMLGEKMYFAYRKKMISPKTMVQMIQKSNVGEHFDSFYWEIIELFESFPEPFKSKKDKA